MLTADYFRSEKSGHKFFRATYLPSLEHFFVQRSYFSQFWQTIRISFLHSMFVSSIFDFVLIWLGFAPNISLSPRNASTLSATIPSFYVLASTIADSSRSLPASPQLYHRSVYSATDQMVEPDGVTPPKIKFTKPADTQTQRYI